jgi:hypothetical protein
MCQSRLKPEQPGSSVHALNFYPNLHATVSSYIVGAPVPVGISIYVSSIEQISEINMVSVPVPAMMLGTEDKEQEAES